MADPRRAQILAVTYPAIAWAVHFVVLYAAASAVCAPRLMLPLAPFWAIAGGVTVLALAVAAIPLFFTRRGDPDLALAAWWSSLISCLAIGSSILPVPFFTSCGA
ncbi:MAG: hypothetical protein ACU0CO_13700 [Shimia sp.]